MLITGVVTGAPAHRLGIRRGDVVFQLGRWYVTDLDTVGAILEDVRPGERLRIGILRGRVRALVVITARQPPTTRPAPDTLRI